MRPHLNNIVDAWSELYTPQVSKAELDALKETIFLTAHQYIKDSKYERTKWRKK